MLNSRCGFLLILLYYTLSSKIPPYRQNTHLQVSHSHFVDHNRDIASQAVVAEPPKEESKKNIYQQRTQGKHVKEARNLKHILLGATHTHLNKSRFGFRYACNAREGMVVYNTMRLRIPARAGGRDPENRLCSKSLKTGITIIGDMSPNVDHLCQCYK